MSVVSWSVFIVHWCFPACFRFRVVSAVWLAATPVAHEAGDEASPTACSFLWRVFRTIQSYSKRGF